MRQKLIALLAVSAFALVGCSAGEPSVEPTATVTVTAAPEVSKETATQDLPAESVEFVEEQFADFAELRSEVHGAKKPVRVKVIDGLHKFCDSGKPFKISETKDLNENLEAIAPDTYCPRLEVE